MTPSDVTNNGASPVAPQLNLSDMYLYMAETGQIIDSVLNIVIFTNKNICFAPLQG